MRLSIWVKTTVNRKWWRIDVEPSLLPDFSLYLWMIYRSTYSFSLLKIQWNLAGCRSTGSIRNALAIGARGAVLSAASSGNVSPCDTTGCCWGLRQWLCGINTARHRSRGRPPRLYTPCESRRSHKLLVSGFLQPRRKDIPTSLPTTIRLSEKLFVTFF